MREGVLKLFVNGVCAANKTDRSHAKPMEFETVFGGLDEAWVIGKIQIIISTEVKRGLSPFKGNGGGLRADENTFYFFKTLVTNVFEKVIDMLMIGICHNRLTLLV